MKEKTALICFFVLALSGFLFAFSAFAQEKESYTVGVLDLDPAGVSKTEAMVLSDELRFHIAKILRSDEYLRSGIDKYEIIERTEMEKILNEYEFQFSGCVSDSCAIELGKMMQLDRMVLGSVGLIGQTYTVSIRMIDIQTAKSMAIANRHHRGEIDDVLGVVIPQVAHDLLLKQSSDLQIAEDRSSSVEERQPVKSEAVQSLKHGYKEPVVSCLLSMLVVPGFGQFYNGDNGKGVLFAGAAVTGYVMLIYGVQQVETGETDYWGQKETEPQSPGTAALGVCVLLGSWVWSSLDAFIVADRRKHDYLRSTSQNGGFDVSFTTSKVCFNYRF
ncbi:MAG: hypothetical protein JXB48_19435 [Candidatus Latescibacteria bacterium]|nr:hypothetical protein [Candidatus Latescibacterota bacterium]